LHAEISRKKQPQHARIGGFSTKVALAAGFFNTMILVLGPLLFQHAVDRHLGVPLWRNEGLARWDAAVEDLLVRGIYRGSRRGE